MYIDAKCREDLSCNSIMYVRETRECHMGNSTLANENDELVFVYRIPDETGDMLQLLYKHHNMTYKELRTENMDWFTKATISMRLMEWPPWKNVFKCARTVQDANFGGMSSRTIRGAVSKKGRAANFFGVLVSLQGTNLDAQNV